MKKKIDLDRQIAADLGIAQRKVSRVTRSLLEEIRRHLTNGEFVYLDGFGRLQVQRITGAKRPATNLITVKGRRIKADEEVPVKHRVHIRKSQVFKRQLLQRWREEKLMEKYGVDEQVDQHGMEKAASEGCPICGSRVEKHGRVLCCPKCGTEPFERSKNGSK